MSEPVRRSREIEDYSKRYIIAPLIDWVVPVFVRLGVGANVVSVSGLLAGVIAALLLSNYALSWTYTIGGFAMLLAWHVLDGADGRVARITNTQSEFGKIIDGICDYVVFTSVYVVFGLILMDIYGAKVWLLLVAAGAMHAVQAGAYELQRQEFEFWGRGKKSAELPDLDNVEALQPNSSLGERFTRGLGLSYARMQYRFSGIDSNIRPALYSHVDGLGEGLDDFRDRYRKLCAKQVLKWGVMCPHYRSYIIIVSCLLQHPEYYFYTEVFVLPLIHIYLVKNQNSFNATLVERLKNTGEAV